MAKDKRYKVVRTLIAAGEVTSFGQIMELVPKTILAQDLGMHHQTFEKVLKDPEKFTFKLAFWIASLIEVEERVIVNLIYTQCMENRNIKKKK